VDLAGPGSADCGFAGFRLGLAPTVAPVIEGTIVAPLRGFF